MPVIFPTPNSEPCLTMMAFPPLVFPILAAILITQSSQYLFHNALRQESCVHFYLHMSVQGHSRLSKLVDAGEKQISGKTHCAGFSSTKIAFPSMLPPLQTSQSLG